MTGCFVSVGGPASLQYLPTSCGHVLPGQPGGRRDCSAYSNGLADEVISADFKGVCLQGCQSMISTFVYVCLCIGIVLCFEGGWTVVLDFRNFGIDQVVEQQSKDCQLIGRQICVRSLL